MLHLLVGKVIGGGWDWRLLTLPTAASPRRTSFTLLEGLGCVPVGAGSDIASYWDVR